MIEEKEILKHAWQLIARPEAWTQNAVARRSDGRAVAAGDRNARCWCLIGSIERAAIDMNVGCESFFAAIFLLCDATEALFGTRAISHINDRHDHGAVCAIFERAISRSAITNAADVKARSWRRKDNHLHAVSRVGPTYVGSSM